MPQTAREQYIQQYGNSPPPHNAPPEQQAAWNNLSNADKDHVKTGAPVWGGMTPEQQQIAKGIWEDIQAGSPVDTEALSSLIGEAAMTPAIRDWFMKTVPSLLTGKGEGFAKEYGVGRKALDVQLMEAERKLAEQFAARGLLDSSAHAAAVGGAAGGYSQALANLMMQRAHLQESSRQFDVGTGLRLGGLGLGWQQQDVANQFGLANFLNAQYLQSIGLESQALDYLTQQQMSQNQFNLANVGNLQYDPTTGLEVIAGLVPAAAAYFGGSGGMDFSWLNQTPTVTSTPTTYPDPNAIPPGGF